ncbi:MAG: hypothetical protein ACI9UA_003351 [Pseudoalteromonas tetraodonis]
MASPAGIFSAPHFHSRFPEVPYNLLVILAITRVSFQLK